MSDSELEYKMGNNLTKELSKLKNAAINKAETLLKDNNYDKLQDKDNKEKVLNIIDELSVLFYTLVDEMDKTVMNYKNGSFGCMCIYKYCISGYVDEKTKKFVRKLTFMGIKEKLEQCQLRLSHDGFDYYNAKNKKNNKIVVSTIYIHDRTNIRFKQSYHQRLSKFDNYTDIYHNDISNSIYNYYIHELWNKKNRDLLLQRKSLHSQTNTLRNAIIDKFMETNSKIPFNYPLICLQKQFISKRKGENNKRGNKFYISFN